LLIETSYLALDRWQRTAHRGQHEGNAALPVPSSVAVETGRRKVIGIIRATQRQRYDVVEDGGGYDLALCLLVST